MQIRLLDDAYIGAMEYVAGTEFATFPTFGENLISKGIAAEVLPDGTYRRRNARPLKSNKFYINDAGQFVKGPPPVDPRRLRAMERRAASEAGLIAAPEAREPKDDDKPKDDEPEQQEPPPQPAQSPAPDRPETPADD